MENYPHFQTRKWGFSDPQMRFLEKWGMRFPQKVQMRFLRPEITRHAQKSHGRTHAQFLRLIHFRCQPRTSDSLRDQSFTLIWWCSSEVGKSWYSTFGPHYQPSASLWLASGITSPRSMKSSSTPSLPRRVGNRTLQGSRSRSSGVLLWSARSVVTFMSYVWSHTSTSEDLVL